MGNRWSEEDERTFGHPTKYISLFQGVVVGTTMGILMAVMFGWSSTTLSIGLALTALMAIALVAANERVRNERELVLLRRCEGYIRQMGLPLSLETRSVPKKPVVTPTSDPPKAS